MTRTRCDRTPAWGKLQAAFDAQGQAFDLRTAFAGDATRFERFSQSAPHVFADLSKNRVAAATHDLLLQLAREQDMAFAEQLQQQLDAPDASSTALIGGRSLNYWRTLRHWPVAAPIGKSRVPTLVLMGAADQAQAPAGLARFEARHHRSMLCTRLIAGADHGLKQKAGRWPGTWPLVQSLMAAPDAQVFAQRCAPTD